MKVNDGNTELNEYSKRLSNRLRNETVKKEAELRALDDVYAKKAENTKTLGEDKYLNSLKRNDDLLLSASSDYENKLKNYKDNLAAAQSSMTREELSIRDDHQQKIDNFKDQFANKTFEQFSNANANQKEINDQMINSVQTISDKASAEKRHIESKARSEVNIIASEYNSKGAAEERDYRSKLNNDIRMHQEDINFKQNELRRTADINTAKTKRLVDEKINVQKEELNYLDNHQKDILNQKQNDFKVRYENMVKEHNHLITELKTHFDTDVKKMVEESTVKKRLIASKSGDSFYRIETLSPKIMENEKEYTVSLPVPEYEKENVHLSVRGRGVKMTLTRRYAESIEDKDGSTNRSTKNELFSREFPSKDLLNPKLVDQKYENGILTYRIQKL